MAASVSVLAQRERGPWMSIARRVDTGSVSVPDNGLIQPSQIVYDGSFRMPSGTTAFGFCTCVLAFDPGGNSGAGSLFVGTYNNNANWGGVSEISIPTLVSSGTVASLNRATTLQPDTDALEGTLFLSRAAGGGASSNITGMLVRGSTLYINAASNYDANGNQPGSFYKRSKDLTSGGVTGPFTTTLDRTGYTAGHLADVPAERQASMGGDTSAGMWAQPIVTRESQGQSSFVFNASAISGTPLPTSTLLFYPPVPGQGLNRGFCGAGQGHPLCIEDGDIQLDFNPAFSGGEGLVIPSTYRTAMFFGGMGRGRWCYGEGTSTLALDGTLNPMGEKYCYDEEDHTKGNHAYYNPAGESGYKAYFWLYDINDLLAVKNGATTSYAPRPYAYGDIADYISTFDALYGGKPGIMGAAYDVAGGRIFLAADKQDGDGPVVHVLHIVPNAPPPPCTVSASGTRLTTSSGTICDSTFHVWNLGTGTSPTIQFIRDGAWLNGSNTGSEILWLNGVIYLHADDGLWYTWIGTFNLWGASDPEGGGAAPVGFFVSTSGSDARSCAVAANVTTPKQTLNSAFQCLNPASTSTNTIWVRGGTYAEQIRASSTAIPSGTSWTNKTRIAAYPGETVWVTPASGDIAVYISASYAPKYIEFDGINVNGSNMVNFSIKIEAWSGGSADHIRFQNSEVIGPTDTASGTDGQQKSTIIVYNGPGNASGGGSNEFINLTVHDGGRIVTGHDHQFYIATANNLIERCNIYHAAAAGIQLYNEFVVQGDLTAGQGPHNNIVRNNYIHDGTTGTLGADSGGSNPRGWGMTIGTDGSNEIYNNVITNVHNIGPGSAGILVLGGSNGNLLYNNTVYGNAPRAFWIQGTGTFVRNNIAYANSGGDVITVDSGGSATQNNNLLGTNPLFTDAGLANFRLISTSSPAYNAGATVTSTVVNGVSVSTDKDGISRPQSSAFDIGAYEFH